MFRTLFSVVAASAIAATANAEPRAYFMPPAGGAPLLGFVGEFVPGYGIVIRSVAPYSPARAAGLERNDVIRAVNHTPIYSMSHYRSLLAASGGYANLTIRDWRSGYTLNVPVSYRSGLAIGYGSSALARPAR